MFNGAVRTESQRLTLPGRRILGRSDLSVIDAHWCPDLLSRNLSRQALIPGWQMRLPEVIVDVCCGGGSLGLLAQTVFPDALVVLSDLDGPALSLAAENRQLHDAPVGLIQGDLLSWLADESTDVILANPPYVDAEDMATLPPEYLHEPQLALDGGMDGLDLVHSLLIDAERTLKQDGILILEVGNSLEAFDAISAHLNPVWVELAYGGHGVAILTKTELSIWRGMTDNLGSRVGV